MPSIKFSKLYKLLNNSPGYTNVKMLPFWNIYLGKLVNLKILRKSQINSVTSVTLMMMFTFDVKEYQILNLIIWIDFTNFSSDIEVGPNAECGKRKFLNLF